VAAIKEDPVGTGVEERVAAAFEAAGVAAAFHAVDLETGREVGHRPDEPVVLASVFKIPILVALVRAADAGTVDLTEQVTVPVEGRAPGPTGLSVLRDPVTMSWRDLARSMIVVSDNAATDVVLERVGIDAVNETLRDLGCKSTEIEVDCRGLFATIYEDAGISALEEFPAVLTTEQLDGWRALRPLETNHGTARDLTHLLRAIWHDEAASGESCALVREILSQQVWPHRLASGFPEDDVATAGKTGTLPRVRNEAGVVSYADGGRYAVATFTTATATTQKHPAADAVIGRVARLAVDALRSS
jgi:beta-lactamase class A